MWRGAVRVRRVRAVARALPGGAEPERVLRGLVARALALGLPPPAALTGDWFDGAAVLAPSVRVDAVADDEAFAVPDRQPVVVDADPRAHIGGGWVGYLGFASAAPPAPTVATRTRKGADGAPERPYAGERPAVARRLPVAAWGWADHVLRRDRSGRWWFEALVAQDEPFPSALVHGLAAVVASADDGSGGPGWRCEDLRVPDRDQHEWAVAECVAAIRAGEVYQANVCTRYELRLDGDPVEVFAAGVARHRPRHAAFVTGRWGALASLSPELFLARRGRRVRSSPIKGTAPRDPADGSGAVNAALLAASTKDRAENVMIVDLVRNDLGRVCEPGTVTVPELLAVRPAPGVWHLVSTVEGRLRTGVADADLLAATFPPGSVTGAPKLRALELLAGLEPAPREAYCGAIGMVSPLAGLQLNVAIRTMEVAPDGRAWIGVGGGITIDSDPAAEWAECLAKAAPLLDLLGSRTDPVDGPNVAFVP